jgi:uncharacterized membrane protein (DUF485 family)
MMQDSEARLHAVAAKRWRIAIWLSILMLVAYYGFILLVAFDKELLSRILIDNVPTALGTAPGLSLGIFLGALVIVLAWVLTLIYVYWANTKYDHEILELAHLRG